MKLSEVYLTQSTVRCPSVTQGRACGCCQHTP